MFASMSRAEEMRKKSLFLSKTSGVRRHWMTVIRSKGTLICSVITVNTSINLDYLVDIFFWSIFLRSANISFDFFLCAKSHLICISAVQSHSNWVFILLWQFHSSFSLKLSLSWFLWQPSMSTFRQMVAACSSVWSLKTWFPSLCTNTTFSAPKCEQRSETTL